MHCCCILSACLHMFASILTSKAASEEPVSLRKSQQHAIETWQVHQVHWAPTQLCAVAVKSSQLAVCSTGPQRATAPRLLPAQHSPALPRTSSNKSASRQIAATSSSGRIAGSLTDSCHSLADAVAPAPTGGKGGAGSGAAPSSSGHGCRSTGEEVEAGTGLPASSCNRSDGMSGGLGGSQERTEIMNRSEATRVTSSTSTGQVHTATNIHGVQAACAPLKGHIVSHYNAVHCFYMVIWAPGPEICRLHKNSTKGLRQSHSDAVGALQY